jgi:hypothetical protein
MSSPSSSGRTVAIYALCDSRVSDPVKRVRYIGQTVRPLSLRLAIHWNTANLSNHRATWMRSMRASGAAVVIEEVCRVPEEQANQTEIEQIAQWRALGSDLTNATLGGEGGRGCRPTPETRRKMSEARKRHRATPETRAKMSASLRARYATPEARAMMRAIVTGRRRSPETRAKMSAARRGEGNGMSKVTWASAEAMRSLYASGEVQMRIAERFSVSPATVNRIVHGAGWVRV